MVALGELRRHGHGVRPRRDDGLGRDPAAGHGEVELLAEQLVGEEVERGGAGPGHGVGEPELAGDARGRDARQAEHGGVEARRLAADLGGQLAGGRGVVAVGRQDVSAEAEGRHLAGVHGAAHGGRRGDDHVEVAAGGDGHLARDLVNAAAQQRQLHGAWRRGRLGPGFRAGGPLPVGRGLAQDDLDLGHALAGDRPRQFDVQQAAAADVGDLVLEALVLAVHRDAADVPGGRRQLDLEVEHLVGDGRHLEVAGEHQARGRDRQGLALDAVAAQADGREIQLDLGLAAPEEVEPAGGAGQTGDLGGGGDVLAGGAGQAFGARRQLGAGVDQQVAALVRRADEVDDRAGPLRGRCRAVRAELQHLHAAAGGLQADREFAGVAALGDGPPGEVRAGDVRDGPRLGQGERQLAHAPAQDLDGVDAVQGLGRGRQADRGGGLAEEDGLLVLLPAVAQQGDGQDALAADGQFDRGGVRGLVVARGNDRDVGVRLLVAGQLELERASNGRRQRDAELQAAAREFLEHGAGGEGELVRGRAADEQQQPALGVVVQRCRLAVQQDVGDADVGEFQLDWRQPGGERHHLQNGGERQPVALDHAGVVGTADLAHGRGRRLAGAGSLEQLLELDAAHQHALVERVDDAGEVLVRHVDPGPDVIRHGRIGSPGAGGQRRQREAK